MNISGGYELITGLFLGSWLIASAGGAALAPDLHLTISRRSTCIFSLSPVISLMCYIYVKAVSQNRRDTILPGNHNHHFTDTCTILSYIGICIYKSDNFGREKGKFIPGKSFSIETAGGIFAGILISFINTGILNTYQILLLIITLDHFLFCPDIFQCREERKLIFKTVYSHYLRTDTHNHPT